MPRPPPEPQTVARNQFKDSQLAPQITTSLFGVLRPRSHVTKETSQEITHSKIVP